MSVYSDLVLKQKFDKLENTQPSITGLSQWILYHRKRHSESVDIWLKEFLTVSSERKLTFLYLANDVLQEGRRKGDEFVKDFEGILEEVVAHLFKLCTATQLEKVNRLLAIWESRNVFPPNFIQLVRQKAQREQHVEKKQPSLEVPLESIHVKPVCVTKINLNEEIESIPDSESLLDQLMSVLAELRDAKQLQKELERSFQIIASGAGNNEKLELIRQGDLSEVSTYSVQLDEDRSTIQSYKESIDATNAINKRAAHLLELYHLALRKEMDNGYRNELIEYNTLSNSIGVLQQKVQQILDKHEIVLTKTASQPILPPPTLKRPGVQTTSLSEYKKQKIENPSGNIINDIL